MFVGYAVERAGVLVSEPVGFAIKASLTILIAAASWRWFEQPINNLKRRFPYAAQARPANRANLGTS